MVLSFLHYSNSMAAICSIPYIVVSIEISTLYTDILYALSLVLSAFYVKNTSSKKAIFVHFGTVNK